MGLDYRRRKRQGSQLPSKTVTEVEKEAKETRKREEKEEERGGIEKEEKDRDLPCPGPLSKRPTTLSLG